MLLIHLILKNVCVAVGTNVADQVTAFSITDTKNYISVVTLLNQDNAKLIELLKSGFKRKISWNKYQTKVLTEQKKSLFRFLNWFVFSGSK